MGGGRSNTKEDNTVVFMDPADVEKEEGEEKQKEKEEVEKKGQRENIERVGGK